MAFITHWLRRVFSPIHIRSKKDHTSKDFRCVTIQYQNNQACEAVRQLESRMNLSTRSSPLVETKERFLSRAAPLLPLAGCTAKYCRCRYIHYQDRRHQERRHFHNQYEASALTPPSQERRSRIDRRQAR